MAWDTSWAGERASEAMAYLAKNYPECEGAPDLHPYQEAAHEAAIVEDRDGYLEALRSYMRVGRTGACRSEGGRREDHLPRGYRLFIPTPEQRGAG